MDVLIVWLAFLCRSRISYSDSEASHLVDQRKCSIRNSACLTFIQHRLPSFLEIVEIPWHPGTSHVSFIPKRLLATTAPLRLPVHAVQSFQRVPKILCEKIKEDCLEAEGIRKAKDMKRRKENTESEDLLASRLKSRC